MTCDPNLNSEPATPLAIARRRVNRLRAFYGHLGTYLAVNAGLLAINLVTSPQRLWVLWVLAGWGIAILIQGFGLVAAGRFPGAEWEARKLRQYVAEETGKGA